MLRSKASSLHQSRSAALGSRRSEAWEIDPEEIQIMQRSDGGPWVLGEGASGLVSFVKMIVPFLCGFPYLSSCFLCHLVFIALLPKKMSHPF